MSKKVFGVLIVAAMALSLAACNTSTNDSSSDAASTETSAAASAEVKDDANPAAAPGEEAGFQEYPIFEDQECGFMNVSAVYFQPVPMSNGNEKIDDFNIHLEADISALENKLGFGVGDWVPYLTVDYKITGSDNKVAAEGTFMEMSASDGPHYGANIKLDKADKYTVEFTIHSPEENGYLLHTDAETGPGGSFDDYFKDGNLTVKYEGWEYTPQEW